MRKAAAGPLSSYRVFIDFDNTITLFDVFDDIVERFSIDRKWEEYESLWKKRAIGSKECLAGQLRSVRVARGDLLRYLSGVGLDPHFGDLLTTLRRAGAAPVIVSDSFSLLIRSILRRRGVKGMKVYSNNLRFRGGRLIPSFPHRNGRCGRCAHCKSGSLRRENAAGRKVIYIGDGLSDTCPAEGADIVFAKGSLKEYLKEKKVPFVTFRDLGDVNNYMKKMVLTQNVKRKRQN